MFLRALLAQVATGERQAPTRVRHVSAWLWFTAGRYRGASLLPGFVMFLRGLVRSLAGTYLHQQVTFSGFVSKLPGPRAGRDLLRLV